MFGIAREGKASRWLDASISPGAPAIPFYIRIVRTALANGVLNNFNKNNNGNTKPTIYGSGRRLRVNHVPQASGNAAEIEDSNSVPPKDLNLPDQTNVTTNLLAGQ